MWCCNYSLVHLLWVITMTTKRRRILVVMLQLQPSAPALVHHYNSNADLGYLMWCCNYSLLHLLWFSSNSDHRPTIEISRNNLHEKERLHTVVSIIFIVTNPYCFTGFDIIPALKLQLRSLTSRAHAIICRLDLSRINSLTHSHRAHFILKKAVQ